MSAWLALLSRQCRSLVESLPQCVTAFKQGLAEFPSISNKITVHTHYFKMYGATEIWRGNGVGRMGSTLTVIKDAALNKWFWIKCIYTVKGGKKLWAWWDVISSFRYWVMEHFMYSDVIMVQLVTVTLKARGSMDRQIHIWSLSHGTDHFSDQQKGKKYLG